MTPETGTASVRHVVHIRLEPDLDENRRVPLERDLHRLVEEHPHAITAVLQRDLGRRPQAPVTATWMVTMDFASMADFEAYLANPLHRDFLTTHQPAMAFITAIQVPIESGASPN